MPRIEIPEGDGGDAVQVWMLRPEMGAAVAKLSDAAYNKSIIPTRVREAARIMHERDIGALPVVADANRVVGMLTATDVMQYIVSGPVRGRTRQVQRPRPR